MRQDCAILLRARLAGLVHRTAIGADVLRPHLLRLLHPYVEEHGRLEVGDFGVLHLAAEHIHEPIGRVVIRWHHEAELLEVGLRPERGAKVHSAPALAEEKHIVEEREERIPRLVDDHNCGHAELAHLLQRDGHRQRARRIQSRCWLVEEQHRGLRRQLQPDVDALPLPAANTALLHTAHDAVLDVVDLHHVQNVLRNPLNALRVHPGLVAQHGGEANLLPNSEVTVNDIVLWHEASHGANGGDRHIAAVDEHSARHLSISRPCTEHVHEGGFACTGGAHDGAHPARLELASHTVQHLFPTVQRQAQLVEREVDCCLGWTDAAELVLRDLQRWHEVPDEIVQIH
mmetsp:Transcript_65710/g.189448  ORF Transcript_65710/g.189448 Transcript_65710/m.189448 type:complete len:344 (+) Transcript_65710:155-1186(+)